MDDTLPKLLARNATRFPTRVASREKEFGIWQSWTWQEVNDQVHAFAVGLHTLGIGRGDRIAIIGQNRPRLYWSMVAAQCIGCIPVPVYKDSVAEEMQYVLDHAEVVAVIAEDQEQVDKILSIQGALPKLRHIIYVDPRGLRNYDHGALHAWRDVQEKGRAANDSDFLDAETAKSGGGDICVVLYTSGTTGKPKGVVLSNDNVLKTARTAAAFDGLTEREETLAYLPMAWVGDFVFSMGQAFTCGFCVSCPENEDTMMHDLREVGPTFFFAPPRVFESLLTRVMIRMEDAGAIKRLLFHYFIEHARRVGGDILDSRRVGVLDRLKYAVGAALIYRPLTNVLGMSRVRVGYTAGESIGPEIFQFYRSLGINLKQLYGQTEAAVFVTQQPDGEVYPESVGVPSPGVEVRIDDNTGEVMYRSPGVFIEYHKDPEATASAKTADGWVHTGDAGFFEEKSGHLRIIDRAADVGKLQNKDLFAPKYIENKLKFYPNILEAVTFGQGRDFVAAFINIDLTAVGNWAERNNIAYASYQELAAHPRVYGMIQSHVEAVNVSLAADDMLSGCQIKRFLVLHKQLDADDGEITRTGKVRRRIVAERYDLLVNALYDGSTSVLAETEVTYEDGRKGTVSGNLEIREAAVIERPRVKDAA